MRSAVAAAVLGVLVVSGARAASEAPPDRIVDRCEAHFRSLTDYECVLDKESQGGEKSEQGAYRIWYKQPGFVKIKVEKGHHRGSSIALGKEGRIHARSGGLFGFIKISMSKTDSRLRDDDGSYAWQCDFGCELNKLREHVHAAKSCTAAPMGEGKEQLTVVYDAQGKQIKEVWQFDTQHDVVLGHETYEGGTLTDRVAIHDYRENTGLSDGFFDG